MVKTLIALTAMPGAGKSTALELAKNFGRIVVMGDVVRDETLKRGLEITPVNLGKVALKLREEEGVDVIATRCIQKLKTIHEKICFIDGIRSMHEVQMFSKYFSLVVIAIIAPDNLRHSWILQRGRADDSNSLDVIIARDNREIGFGLLDVIKSAKIQIQNTGTIEELKVKCKTIFEEIIGN